MTPSTDSLAVSPATTSSASDIAFATASESAAASASATEVTTASASVTNSVAVSAAVAAAADGLGCGYGNSCGYGLGRGSGNRRDVGRGELVQLPAVGDDLLSVAKAIEDPAADQGESTDDADDTDPGSVALCKTQYSSASSVSSADVPVLLLRGIASRVAMSCFCSESISSASSPSWSHQDPTR